MNNSLATGDRIPPIRELVQAWQSSSRYNNWRFPTTPTSPIGIILSNPYVCSPVLSAVALLLVPLVVPSSVNKDAIYCSLLSLTYVFTANNTASAIWFSPHASLSSLLLYPIELARCLVLYYFKRHRGEDSPVENWKLSCGSCARHVASGYYCGPFILTLLLQVERHPQVLHLPAPHLWQLTPAAAILAPNSKAVAGPLIVSLELHVKEDLGDEDVLALTKWAWERCIRALGGTVPEREPKAVEVTIGVVRG